MKWYYPLDPEKCLEKLQDDILAAEVTKKEKEKMKPKKTWFHKLIEFLSGYPYPIKES